MYNFTSIGSGVRELRYPQFPYFLYIAIMTLTTISTTVLYCDNGTGNGCHGNGNETYGNGWNGKDESHFRIPVVVAHWSVHVCQIWSGFVWVCRSYL